jgi:hypothetical protein
MKVIKIKYIQVFPNGSSVIHFNTYTNLNQFRLYDKGDSKNFFFNKKKKILNFKKFASFSKYKTQYLL